MSCQIIIGGYLHPQMQYVDALVVNYPEVLANPGPRYYRGHIGPCEMMQVIANDPGIKIHAVRLEGDMFEVKFEPSGQFLLIEVYKNREV